MDLKIFQDEVYEWSINNFGEHEDPWLRVFGMMEELGELARAILKSSQRIRRMDEATAKAQIIDALGDFFVFAADYCARTGLSLDDAVEQTWTVVKNRNWKLYPGDGLTH
jgi:NTP pyrophosphatase (non-canonical NTP hydrolase)